MRAPMTRTDLRTGARMVAATMKTMKTVILTTCMLATRRFHDNTPWYLDVRLTRSMVLSGH